MFENTYQSMNEQIAPSDSLLRQTLDETAGILSAGKRRPLPSPHTLLKAAAVALLGILLVTTPVMAASVPALYELMYRFSPEITQLLVPVQKSCEDNGIRMEVVSAAIDGDTASLYVALQDLTGDRVDETTDLFDSYAIHSPFGNVGHCERIGYDDETKTALFLVTISDINGRKLEGRKVTFSVREFISRKTALEDTEVPIDLTALKEADATQSVKPNGLSYPSSDAGLKAETDRMLLPEAPLYTPVSHLSVTAAAYVDDALHLQLMTDAKPTLDPHGYFYLLAPDGEERLYDYSVSFREQGEDGKQICYQEFVFLIPRNEISGFRLFGSFYTSGLNTKGDWRVTFPIKNE